MPDKPHPTASGGQLERSLTLKDTTLFGVGVMLGAGIYAIIGEAAGHSGNLLWLAFLVAAGTAFLTAMSYAEFVSRFPDAGGSFEYIKQGLGEKFAYCAGILIFFTGIVAAAAIAISFADYFSQLLETPDWITVIGIIAAMALVNIVGVQSSSGFNAIATVVTLIGLLVVIGCAIPDWGEAKLFEAPPTGYIGIFGAAALVFFSFVGFEDLVKMAEETKDARRTLPKALMISAIVVLVVYLLVAISAVAVLDWEKLADSDGPLSAVIETRLGRYGAIGLAVVALFATSKTILSNILGTSRLLYDIARDSEVTWLKKLTHIPEKMNTPVAAIILVTVLAMAFGLIGNLSVVASISNAFIMTVFATVNIALIAFRVKNPDAEKPPFRIPGSVGRVPIIPVLGVLATLTLLFFNLRNVVME